MVHSWSTFDAAYGQFDLAGLTLTAAHGVVPL